MAKCDQGYICDVCGEEVKSIAESDLYLRFVIGEIDSRQLLSTPERHIRCNPVAAQFIQHDEFEPITVEGDFSRAAMDPVFVSQRTDLMTRGWLRLQQISRDTQSISITDYPLPEFR